MCKKNLIFGRAYFEARKFADASGIEHDEAHRLAIMDARREVAAAVASILYA